MAIDPFPPTSAVVAAFLAPDGATIEPVSSAEPMPVSIAGSTNSVIGLPTLLPISWLSTVEMDMTSYSSVVVQIEGLSGGDTIQVFERYGGVPEVITWVNLNGFGIGNAVVSNGNYVFTGGGFMTYAKTGVASGPSVTISGGN